MSQALQEALPVADSVALHAQEINVGSRAQQAVLQVLAEAVIDRESDDEGRHTGGHAKNGNDRHQTDDGLAALGAEVASGDEEFETHKGISSRLDYREFGAGIWRARCLYSAGIPRQNGSSAHGLP